MNLLFDLDGTLTDPFLGITRCIAHGLSTLGRPVPPPEHLRWCIGPPLKNSFSGLLDAEDDTLAEQALAIYRERFGSKGLYENEVYEDIPDTLKALETMGHDLYVATSKPTVYAKQILEHFGLHRYFKAIHGSELDGTRTDKTELIAYILRTQAIPSSESLMIGDREYDMIGAAANGVCGIGVLWGYGTIDELKASGARVCLGEPRELKRYCRLDPNRSAQGRCDDGAPSEQ